MIYMSRFLLHIFGYLDIFIVLNAQNTHHILDFVCYYTTILLALPHICMVFIIFYPFFHTLYHMDYTLYIHSTNTKYHHTYIILLPLNESTQIISSLINFNIQIAHSLIVLHDYSPISSILSIIKFIYLIFWHPQLCDE